MQDGFPYKFTVEELTSHLFNPGPGGFHADSRFKLADGNQTGQPKQAAAPIPRTT
jgi:hypothetical protein